MRLQPRSHSKVILLELLKKRKKTLKGFMNEIGIVTYESLRQRCDNMGVQPPTEQDFKTEMGNPVLHEASSPTEGIVVLSALPEMSENLIKESEISEQEIQHQEASSHTKKKKKIENQEHQR